MKELSDASEPPAIGASESVTYRLVIRAKILPDEPPSAPAPRRWDRRVLAWICAVVVVVILSWIGYRAFRADTTSPPAVSVASQRAPVVPTPSPPRAPAIDTPAPPQSIASNPQTTPAPSSSESRSVHAPQSTSSAINEAIPKASQRALQTIRGTIRVSIRVTVDKNGTVTRATVEESGPSRYFERVATEAARKWTFTPADSGVPRTALLQFSFTRAGVTAQQR